MAKSLASYKYKHDEGAMASPWRGPVLLALALAVILGFLFHSAVGAVLLLILIVATVVTAGQELLRVGPRYLVAGQQVVYFRQVTRVVVERQAGNLWLHLPGGARWQMERDRFPTGARKPDKIAKNKAAKFDKLTAKLVAKVRRANPSAEVVEQ